MLFGSSSKSNQTNNTYNSDERLIADGGAVGINSGGGSVDLQIVADEAWELAGMAMTNNQQAFAQSSEILAKALDTTQANSRTEAAQIGEQFVKIGIPALVVGVLAWGLLK